MSYVQVHHPLQQGLRQISFIIVCADNLFVQVHHPLQQGLRHLRLRDVYHFNRYKCIIHYNKD